MTDPFNSATDYLRDRPVLTRRQTWMLGLFLPLILALAGAALTTQDWVRRIEQASIDWRFSAVGPRRPPPNVVIVEIDEASRENLKRGDRLLNLREPLASAIDHLSQAGAAVIALDLYLSDRTDDAADARLAEAIAGADVILAAAYSGGRTKRAHPIFLASAPAEGDISVESDSDGVLRRLPSRLYLDVPAAGGGIERLPHFPLMAAMYLVKSDQVEVARMFEGGRAHVAGRTLAPRALVDFTAAQGQGWTTLTFEQAATNQFDPLMVKDAIILVGESRMIADQFAMPLAGVDPGVYYHANVIAQILSGRIFDEYWASELPAQGLAAVLALLAGLVAWNQQRWFTGRRGGYYLAAIVIGGVSLFLLGWTLVCFAMFHRGVLLPLAGPLAAMGLSLGTGLVAQWLIQNARTRRLMERNRRIEALFGQSVSENVLEALRADPQTIMQTHVREVSVLFCDLRSYTSVAEERPPEDVAAMLNEYFTHIAPAVFENDGFLDKFVGDALMAVYSVPLAQADHADRAVRTAIAIKRRLADLNRARAARGEAALSCGVGIHSGPAAAGHIGTRRRSNYSVIGHTVNLAARIEKLTSHGEILISQEVRDRIGDGYSVRPWRTVEVKGVQEAQQLFVVGAEEP
ncbi:MAG TPA: adenylate/guanylate cyclase domain-containing protein [Phycisphaerae bacterium]|nr:adenylate/guanylate cyclase domain-containing protein [Phycisphaerae bacterium]